MMKKYVFLIKKATKNEVEIEANNKSEAFKKVIELMTENRENDIKNIDLDKEIIRFRLTKIIEENEDGKLETKPYKRDEELTEDERLEMIELASSLLPENIEPEVPEDDSDLDIQENNMDEEDKI